MPCCTLSVTGPFITVAPILPTLVIAPVAGALTPQLRSAPLSEGTSRRSPGVRSRLIGRTGEVRST